jgi:hypothetical protein
MKDFIVIFVMCENTLLHAAYYYCSFKKVCHNLSRNDLQLLGHKSFWVHSKVIISWPINELIVFY